MKYHVAGDAFGFNCIVPLKVFDSLVESEKYAQKEAYKEWHCDEVYIILAFA